MDIMSTRATCTECGKNGSFDARSGTEPTLYISDACKKGHTCCKKFLCARPCKLNIKCDKCGRINLLEREARDEDVGWNYLECKTKVTIVCAKCTSTINHPLHWNHKCSVLSTEHKCNF